MPSETTIASPDWPVLQGRILEGGYEIGECLVASPASASFKIRVLGDRFTQVVANVFTAEAAPLDQYSLWHEALHLHHPNISSPIRVGRLEWNGAFYPYVLLPKADENLAGVITERALTSDEARELLRSVGAGLEHLHANGFVHSSLAPGHILAMGDSIRISSTSIRRINTPVDEGEPGPAYKAPESASENLTVAADMWCLGATLFEVMTQKKCGENCREEAKSLPAPFDWIIERCLDPEPHERPTFSEVFAMLSGAVLRPEPVIEPKTIEPEATEPPPAPTSASVAMAAGVSAAATAGAPAAAVNGSVSVSPETAKPPAPPIRPSPPGNKPSPTAAGKAPLRSAVRRAAESPRPKLTSSPKPVYTENRPRVTPFPDEKPEESPRTKFISYVVLAIVLVGGLLWLARPKPEKSHATVNPAAARTQTATPAPAAPGAATPSAGPAASAIVPSAAAHATPGAEVWRVVVFTYDRKDAAEERVHALEKQHPGFNPEVFSKDGNGPFLIVLGGPMTRDQANRMRQRARSSGFPQDAYVQNFDH